jgi:hypothetical protein
MQTWLTIPINKHWLILPIQEQSPTTVADFVACLLALFLLACMWILTGGHRLIHIAKHRHWGRIALSIILIVGMIDCLRILHNTASYLSKIAKH